MIVTKNKPVAIGRRGNFVDISGELSQSGFTGVAEVSYRLGEISKAKAVFVNGKIVQCKVNKLISKTELIGDEALDELLRVEKCVVDIYTINESSIDFEEEVTSPAQEFNSGILEPEIQLCREELLKKYNIKEPSEDEIEAIIRKAVEDELEEFEIEVFGEFDSLKKELKDISRKYLGKLSKKVEESIDQTTFPEELYELVSEIRNSKSLLIFVPKERLNRLAEEMTSLLKVRNVEKMNN